MKLMLDTNICIYILKKQPKSVLKQLQAYQFDDIAISSVVYAELLYGVEKSEFPDRNRERLNHLMNALTIAPFTEEEAFYYGRLRADLAKKGKIIGANDLFIAAHALSLSLPLATNNAKEFKRVPGLDVLEWK